MALRLGKKKDADATVVTEPDGTTTVVTDTARTTTMPSEDQFADLIPDNLPPKRRGPSAAVIGGAAFALMLAAVGAWWMFGRQSVEDVDDSAAVTTVASAPPARKPPGAPPQKGASAKPGASVKPVVPAKSVANVEVAGDRPMSRPEKAGIVPPKAAAGKPVIAAAQADSVPRFVPVPNAPTPVPLIRPGMAGQPGRRADRRQVIVSASGFASDNPAVMAQLKTLWNNGAAAKKRGDFAGARNSWQRILEISPGHPGIQEAIDKLPA